MKNETLQPEVKEYPIIKKVGKVLLIAAAVLSVLFTAQAAFKDFARESLENNLKSASINYDRAVKRKVDANNDERLAAELYCNSYKALKAYKEFKGEPLSDPTSNPCVAVKAPQEGF